MSGRVSEQIHAVYDATTNHELEEAYDGWAERYEADLAGFGYRTPAVAAGMFARHVPAGARPLLEAGCGTGLLGHALSDIGFADIVGMDSSRGMLDAAGRKGAYSRLVQGRLGEPLDFADGQFAATAAIGVFSPGHAPAEGFGELIRVTRPGGVVLFSIRHDTDAETGFAARADTLAGEGRWSLIEATRPYQTMPFGEPEVLHRVLVYRVAG